MKKKGCLAPVLMFLVVFVVVFGLGSAIFGGSSEDDTSATDSSPSVVEQLPEDQMSDTPAVPEDTQPTVDNDATTGQKNALGSAIQYISTMPFSRDGLVDQLLYEGYSQEEAEYGADNCGADWSEQAVKMASSYLSTMAFSAQGLTNQLVYEGFSQEQAEYGVTSCGADWDEQAVKMAASYLSSSSFSRQSLIDQLIYEGFSQEQAENAATQNGY